MSLSHQECRRIYTKLLKQNGWCTRCRSRKVKEGYARCKLCIDYCSKYIKK